MFNWSQTSESVLSGSRLASCSRISEPRSPQPPPPPLLLTLLNEKLSSIVAQPPHHLTMQNYIQLQYEFRFFSFLFHVQILTQFCFNSGICVHFRYWSFLFSMRNNFWSSVGIKIPEKFEKAVTEGKCFQKNNCFGLKTLEINIPSPRLPTLIFINANNKSI